MELEEAEEQTSDADLEADDENGLDEVEGSVPMVAELRPNEIRDYVKSLKASSVHWFRTFYPEMSDDLTRNEIEWIQRLNRLGMAYFRPLLMAILKKCDDPGQRIGTFKEIERFCLRRVPADPNPFELSQLGVQQRRPRDRPWRHGFGGTEGATSEPDELHVHG